CLCERYQVNPKFSHLHVVKRIFRYLKGQPKSDLWYLKDSPFDLVAYTDSDYAGASLDRKSIIGGCKFLRCRLVSWQCKKKTVVANSTTEAEYMAASSCCGQLKVNAARHNLQLLGKNHQREAQIHAKVDGKKIIISEASIRRDLQFGDEEGVDCLPTTTIFEQFALIGKPKRKVIEVPQPSDSMENVADEAVYKELDDSLVRVATIASSLEAEQDSGGGLRCQEAIGDTITQTRVLDLEKTKTIQALGIDSLKRRVKKLEKKQRSRTHKLKRLYKVGLTARVESSNNNKDLGEDASKQGRISDIYADEGITLVSTHDDAEMFDADKDLHGEEVFVAKQDENNVVEKEVDVAQVQVVKTYKPKVKAKRIIFHEPEESITTTTIVTATIPKPKSQDKGKAILIEEPVKLKKKDQIMFDEEVALKLQAELQVEFDKEEQRLARESTQKEQEVNSALIEEWNDIQAKFDVDYQLAKRLQAKEQQELNDAEKATLFMKLLEKRRKFFTVKRGEEKRNKPPTRAQQRKSSKKAKAEVIEQGSSKRAGTELEQEIYKKEKIDDDKEIAELKQLVKIIQDEEGVAIDAIPLVVKPPSIVDWKVHKEGKKIYYKIIRTGGSSKIYLVFSHMLRSFDKEDVETLWKLVKAKHGSIRPEGDYERVLRGDLKDPVLIANFQDSSEDSQSIPLKADLDNLFGALYEEYYTTSTPKVSNNSAANILDNEDTPSSSSIVIEEDEAPQLVSSAEELVDTEPNNPLSNENVDELVQEDVAELN
nr:putative ribonuclease H-like domain-containing protein [Tanacetum cinerariifolium]